MRRFISSLLTLALALGLCACGRSAGGQSGSGSSGNASWQEQYDLGMRYLSEGKYQEAILAFTAAIEIDPKQAPAYVGRGNAYVLSGETEDNLKAAQADFEQAIELDELLAEAYLGLADVYIRRGDYDKAREILEQGLEKIGTSEAISAKLAELDSGNITDSSGNLRRMSGYDEQGNLIWWHDYTYDVQGRKASATSYDAAGNQTGHVDCVYDSAGNQTVGYAYMGGSDGAIGRAEFDFDSNGNQIEERYYWS